MNIAILGATSQIAKDLILSFSAQREHELILFVRVPEVLQAWLTENNISDRYRVNAYENFSVGEHFDAIINFVGVGNPAQALAMGASIFDVTLKYDQIALDYVKQNPACRYIFLSSGAAYGSNFKEPVDEQSRAIFAVNSLQAQDWYAVAKLHAECRHRAFAHLPIVDIRIFNYFSHRQDISARFFITDLLRALQSGETFITSSDNIVRDYIGPDDFHKLLSLILAAPATNDVVDCYTQEPVAKNSLLVALKIKYGLNYEIKLETNMGINATGFKLNYFSKNFRAGRFGYIPHYTSLDCVLHEVDKFFLHVSDI